MAVFTTIDPRTMDPVSWADATMFQLLQYGTPGRLEDPAKWREWACQALSIMSSHGIMVPDPYDFAGWADWASQFNESLDAV